MTATEKTHSPPPPEEILSRSDHDISRKLIDPDALKVLYRLERNGYKAYLVGGCVRDLLLGRTPKDFDVGTDATPNQVKKLFRNCFLVGRRFRLAHIRFAGGKVIEVATFRRQPAPEELPEDPDERQFFAENVFGTPAEDAFRRDFTINALFYDIATFAVIDHVGGLRDLQERRLRVIGDPLVRFTEDPVRMLRALEFSARLGFSLDREAHEAILQRAPLIGEAAPARIREEVMELFRHRVAAPVFERAQGLGLLAPLLGGYSAGEQTFSLLEKIDERTAAGGVVTEGLVLAALFLERFCHLFPAGAELTVAEAVRHAGLLIAPHCDYFRIAHGTRHQARELLVGIYRLSRGRGRRGERRFLHHPSIRDALELMRMWSEVTGEGGDLVAAWQKALAGEPEEEKAQASGEPAPAGRRRRRRRPRRRPPKTQS